MKKEIENEYDRGEYVQVGQVRIANSFISQIAEFDGISEDELLATINDYPLPDKTVETETK